MEKVNSPSDNRGFTARHCHFGCYGRMAMNDLVFSALFVSAGLTLVWLFVILTKTSELIKQNDELIREQDLLKTELEHTRNLLVGKVSGFDHMIVKTQLAEALRALVITNNSKPPFSRIRNVKLKKCCLSGNQTKRRYKTS